MSIQSQAVIQRLRFALIASDQQHPLKITDVLKVYHGFHSIDDALDAAKYGLSGASKARRLYSYESNNNPNGLFVTTDISQAKDFTHREPVILEFYAPVKSLEAPVWPGGSYTVQGERTQSWPEGREGRIARRQAQKARDLEYANQTRWPHVAQSDPGLHYLAYMLYESTEHQALFVGNLNPERMKFHVVGKEHHGKAAKYIDESAWKIVSAKELVEQYTDHQPDPGRSASWSNTVKLYGPEDDFSPETFFPRLQAQFKFFDEAAFKKQWYLMQKTDKPMLAFRERMAARLWPKQLIEAFKYFSRTWGKAPH